MTVDKEQQAAADYEARRRKDAEKLAQRKKRFDANRFAHIEKQNKLHGPPSPQPPPTQSKAKPPPPPATFEESNDSGDTDTKKKNQKTGWRIFKKKKTPASTTELIKEGGGPTPTTTESTPAVTVDLRDADFKPTNVPVPVAPNWAMREPKQTPSHIGHSSDRHFSGPKSQAALTAAAQTQTKLPPHPPTSTTTPYQYDPSQPNTYTTVGYGATGTTTKKKPNNTVAQTRAAFQQNPPKLYTGPPRNMQTEQVVSTTTEAMDNRGTITRTITKTMTDPRTGQTRTETTEIRV